MRFPTINWTKLAEAWAPLSPHGVFFSPDGAIYGPDGALISPARATTQSTYTPAFDSEGAPAVGGMRPRTRRRPPLSTEPRSAAGVAIAPVTVLR